MPTPAQSSKAAKQLCGSFANLKPDNPDIFIASVAAVLAQYPLGLVDECADPRVGMARTVRFFGIEALVEWCDQRLAFYQGLASYTYRAPKLPAEPDLTADEWRRGNAAMRGLFKAIKSGRDLKTLDFEAAVALGGEAESA